MLMSRSKPTSKLDSHRPKFEREDENNDEADETRRKIQPQILETTSHQTDVCRFYKLLAE